MHDCNSHSVWIQDSSVDSYVIYFTTALTSTLEGFGFYKCNSKDDYLTQIDLDNCESPAGILGCSGAPKIYCPTLIEDDISYMMDGGGADTNLEFLDIADFYNCSHWFEWDDSSNYDSTTQITFNSPNTWCESTSSSNSDSNNNVTPGEHSNPSGDTSDDSNKMDSKQKAILWIFITIFMIICISVIALVGYRWRKKKLQSETELGAGLLFDR